MDTSKEVLRDKIRLSLLKQGHNFSSWSRANNFNPAIAVRYIHRYINAPAIPQSPKIYEILLALKRDTGVNLMDKQAS